MNITEVPETGILMEDSYLYVAQTELQKDGSYKESFRRIPLRTFIEVFAKGKTLEARNIIAGYTDDNNTDHGVVFEPGDNYDHPNGEKCGLLLLMGYQSDEPVVLRHLANGIESDDAATVGQLGVKYIDNTKSSSVILSELTPSVYVLNGNFPYYADDKSEYLSFGNTIVTVNSIAEGHTCLDCFVRGGIIHIEFCDGGIIGPTFREFEYRNFRVDHIDENSDNEHYPSAKAVYDFLINFWNLNCSINTITSSSDNPIFLRSLESGLYRLTGHFKYAEGITSSNGGLRGTTFSENSFVIINQGDSYSAVRLFNPVGTDTIFKITDSEATLYHHSHLKMLTEDNLVFTINKTSNDEQIPSAKAVYDLVKLLIGESSSGSSSGEQEITDYSVFFDIDEAGVVSLKQEYRGLGIQPTSSGYEYTYSISNNGLGIEGDKIGELPDVLVIPDEIGGIAVSALAEAMLGKNYRVKSVTIPSGVDTIPKKFADNAINLIELQGTENIETIGQTAFQKCGIKKALFPNLKQFEGVGQFNLAANLEVVNIGNTVTVIPQSCFRNNDSLSVFLGGASVTDIGSESFFITRSLRSLPFVVNVKSIGDSAFELSSVIDIGNTDWWAFNNTSGCSFGTKATPAHYNPSAWWLDCDYTACENKLGSTFHQDNPKWANTPLPTTTGDSADKWGDGCSEISAVHIFSALTGVKLDSPEEFIELIRYGEDANGSLLSPIQSNDYGYADAIRWLTYLHLKCELLEGGYNNANLQKIYDALADGALILTHINPNHAAVIYGVAPNGDMLVLDSDGSHSNLQDYTARTYQQPVWSFARAGNTAVIVKK